MSTWSIAIKQFEGYLQLEKSLSGNSVEAYVRDIGKLRQYLELEKLPASPQQVTTRILRDFLTWLGGLGMSATSQARTLSGIKAFYNFLIMEDMLTIDPTDTLEAPKTGRKLPDTLSYPEIEQLLSAIDLSTPEGTRNRAILEVLYSSGLRVSELTELRLSNLYADQGFVRVTGAPGAHRARRAEAPGLLSAGYPGPPRYQARPRGHRVSEQARHQAFPHHGVYSH
jgi:integrase/recombinase XerD